MSIKKNLILFWNKVTIIGRLIADLYKNVKTTTISKKAKSMGKR